MEIKRCYLIKRDSAHTGKESVLVVDLESTCFKNYKVLFETLKEARLDFADEIYYYSLIDFDDNDFLEKLRNDWNLFYSTWMEKEYSSDLISFYNKEIL